MRELNKRLHGVSREEVVKLKQKRRLTQLMFSNDDYNYLILQNLEKPWVCPELQE